MYEIHCQHEDGRTWDGRSHEVKELAIEEALQQTADDFAVRAVVTDGDGVAVWHSHHYEVLVEGGGDTWRSRYPTGDRDWALQEAAATEDGGQAEGVVVRNAVTGELIHEWWSPDLAAAEVDRMRTVQAMRVKASSPPRAEEKAGRGMSI